MTIAVNPQDFDPIRTIDASGRTIRYVEHAAGWRYATLLEKEPETIEWIDGFAPGDTLWDIGANVGIYSVYAATRGIATLAFEPHFANYQQLCISIALNDLQDEVIPLCLALADRKSVGTIHLASIETGTSMSNFGEATDFRGTPFIPAFKQGMVSYDIDSFIADFDMGVPTHIKIDVDGIELAIVKGATRTLADPRVKSVSIELIETDHAQVGAVTALLEAAGLCFVHKKQNAAFATPETRDVLNYLFRRPVAGTTGSRPIDTDTIVAHIVDRIAAAPVDSAPSANIYLTDALPAALYADLLARLPDDGALDAIEHPDAVAADGRKTRRLLDLTPASLDRLAPEDHVFWQSLMDAFTAPALVDAVTRKFAPTLAARFGDTIPELVAVPLLYRDYPGYRIGIHPDTEGKIATLQFYLPSDESQRHLGTTFHTRTENGFARLKTNAFLPNTGYAFVRTDESWHSVDELGPQETVRNSIALTFYIKGQEYRSAPNSVVLTAPAPIDDDAVNTALRMLASSFTRRDDVATLIRPGGVGVELGVAAGEFSERILNRSQIGYLYSIDMWAGDRGHGVDQYKEAITRLNPHRDRNAILRMRFDEALDLFNPHSLDFIYVDGYAHTGEENGRTFDDWYPKLKSAGIIAGDDYHDDWPLVMAAVDAFVARNGLELHVIQCSENTWNSMYPTWFAMKP